MYRKAEQDKENAQKRQQFEVIVKMKNDYLKNKVLKEPLKLG